MDTYTLKVDDENQGLRLDVFLTKNLPQIPSRSFSQRLIAAQNVTVNHRPMKAHYKVSLGDELQVCLLETTASDLKAENIPLDIFYEDEDILLINKSIGMSVHPAAGHYSGTLVNALLGYAQDLSNVNGPLRAGIVHRLDKETSGLLVAAKNNFAHVNLARQFEERRVFKRYAALVEGLIDFDEGVIEAPLGRHPYHRKKRAVVSYTAKEATTVYRVLRRFEKTTLVALYPRTGRTHQLRVHMSHLGHPVLGDAKYGKKDSFPRLALHAQAIGFRHPRHQCYVEFSSRIPLEFLNNRGPFENQTN